MAKEKSKSEYIKKDGHIDFKKLDRDISWMIVMTRVVMLLINPSIRWFEFIAYAIVGSAYMSLLMIFIWTGNLLLLKIWATPIAFALILMCISEGIKALRKKRESISDLMNRYEKKDYQMSRKEFLILKNSLDAYNDYEKNVKNTVILDKPTYNEYKSFVLELKPQLISNENYIKLLYSMFENGKWTNAGFIIKDWKDITKKVMLNIDSQLDDYINFYNIKQPSEQHESSTN